MDWKSILDKAIDIGGPIAAKVIDVPAPGAGTLIGEGLPLLKAHVVDKYVPGDEAAPEAAPSATEKQPASRANWESSEAKAAVAFLLKQGWSQDEIQQHMTGPQSPRVQSQEASGGPPQRSDGRSKEQPRHKTSPFPSQVVYGFYDAKGQWQQSRPLPWEEAAHQISATLKLKQIPYLWDAGQQDWRPVVEPQHGAAVVHGVLDEAGWNAAQKQALLKGPDALKEHWQSGKEEPSGPQASVPKRGHVEDIIFFDKRT